MGGSGRRVLAVDLPSGLDADTGHPHGTAARADATLSFIGRKLGCYVGRGPDYAGLRCYDDLGVPAQAFSGVSAAAELIGPRHVLAALPRRTRTAHKGRHGHVLVIGGGPGMAGAVRLAGLAALRSGAGLVSVAAHPASVAAAAGAPELMVTAAATPGDLTRLFERCSVVAVGPGLGTDDWASEMLDAALAAGRPLVVDADALNLLARRTLRRDDWILTPHPGEAGRLLGVDATQVQSDRLGAARELERRYGGTVVLKGAGTIVLSKSAGAAICDRGNPGMAVAGMGDVLTGAAAGIAAQCRDLPLAAAAAVYAHADAGDRAARAGERGLLASDVIDALRGSVNPR
jgi:NAD(P)H-hydrate epimerase